MLPMKGAHRGLTSEDAGQLFFRGATMVNLRIGSAGRRKKSPAKVIFTTQRNSDGKSQACVFAECLLSGIRIGPIWGHGDASIKKVCAELTHECDCPAKYHSAREFVGKYLG